VRLSRKWAAARFDRLPRREIELNVWCARA
jgi:hypothetical protein